ncbi:MAG: ABC transporter ATP-binding protein, partial [Terriglobia bacterium]
MLKSWGIVRYLRPYTHVLVIALILMGATAALEGLRALLVRPIIDNLLSPSTTVSRIELLPQAAFFGGKIYLDQINPFPHLPLAVAIGLMIVGTTLVKGLTEYFSTYLLSYLGQSVVMDLRNAVYYRVIHQSSSFFHTHSTGRLISRITNDIERIQFACSTTLADALKQGLTLIVFLYLVFAIDWRLALISLTLAPLIIYPAKYLGRKIQKTSRSSQDKMEEITNILQETIVGHRIVKAFGMEGFEYNKFKTATRRLARINLSWARMHAITSPYMELVGAITIAGLFYYIQNQISRSNLTLGMFGVFITALVGLYDPVRRISGIYNSFQQAIGASGKVFEIMREKPEVVEKPGALTLKEFRREIEFRNVSFNYQDSRLPVLKNVDLRVTSGQVIALVGSSGSGKTTLANLLPRFFDPTSGQILIDGIDIRDVTLSSLRSLIGMVTQETVLFNDTVRNNICYGRDLVSEAEMMEAATAALVH